jgi:hypothetical protein
VSRRICASFVLAVVLAACSGSGPAATAPQTTAATTAASAVAASSSAVATGASPTILPTPSTFASALYGYSLTVPAGWYAAAAILPWDGASAPSDGDPTADKFGGPGKASAFAFAAPTMSSLDKLTRDTIKWTVRDHGDTCPATAPEVTESVDFGSAKGTFLAWNCGILINQVVAVHDGKAYTLVMRDPGVAAATDPADRAVLDQLLASVVFGSWPG